MLSASAVPGLDEVRSPLPIRAAEPLSSRLLAMLETLDHVTYTIARTPDEIAFARRMRYEPYLREGMVSEIPAQSVDDPLDLADNAHVVIVSVAGVPCATVRLHVLDRERRTGPSLVVGRDIVNQHLDAGKVIIDPGKFAATREASHAYPMIALYGLRAAAMACVHFGADLVVFVIRPEHGAFYKRVFQARQWVGPVEYVAPPLRTVCSLYGAEVSARATIAARYPFLLSTPAERQSLFDGVGEVPASVRAILVDGAETGMAA